MANEIIKEGGLVLIYPEQEMWFNYKKPREFRIGAYHYAAEFGVPIIPCFAEMIDTAKEERMDGDPNQMNIESMYTDIDLDVDTLESEFQAGFEELKWFIDQYLIHMGNPDYTSEEVEFIFDRDFFINENAKIDNIMKSVGLVSDETLLEHHPMVKNKLVELERKEAQKQAELDEMDATLKVQAKNTPKPTKSTGGDK